MRIIPVVIFLLFASACNTQQTRKIDDYSKRSTNKYQADFLKKYAQFHVNTQKHGNPDYIGNYVAFCNIGSYRKDRDYHIMQSCEIYQVKDSVCTSDLDYELIHFDNKEIADSIVKKIKSNNCIDDITLKIHRIYRIGRNTMICINFSNFDIVGYENFLMSEFAKPLNIEVINIAN